MKKISLFLIFAFSIIFSACKKEKGEKACWQLVDAAFTDIDLICDKTEEEMVDCVKSGACDVYDFVDIANFNNCMYYKVGGPKLCWKVTDPSRTGLWRDITENKAKLYERCARGQPTIVELSPTCQ